MSTPRPPRPNAAFLLAAVGGRVRDRIDDALREMGLTYRHFSALGHLSAEPEISYSELGRRVGVTAQSMQATVNALESAGTVERVTASGRGRRAQLRVTPEGQTLLARAALALDELEEQVLLSVPEEHRRDLTAQLLALFLATAGSGAR